MRFLQNALAAQGDSSAGPELSPFGASGLPERIARLEKVLNQLREQARSRPDGELKSKLLPACDLSDAGVETVRKRLEDLAVRTVFQRRRSALLKRVAGFDAIDLNPEQMSEWDRIRAKISALNRP